MLHYTKTSEFEYSSLFGYNEQNKQRLWYFQLSFKQVVVFASKYLVKTDFTVHHEKEHT
jgi:hypothetical protein